MIAVGMRVDNDDGLGRAQLAQRGKNVRHHWRDAGIDHQQSIRSGRNGDIATGVAQRKKAFADALGDQP